MVAVIIESGAATGGRHKAYGEAVREGAGGIAFELSARGPGISLYTYGGGTAGLRYCAVDHIYYVSRLVQTHLEADGFAAVEVGTTLPLTA